MRQHGRRGQKHGKPSTAQQSLGVRLTCSFDINFSLGIGHATIGLRECPLCDKPELYTAEY